MTAVAQRAVRARSLTGAPANVALAVAPAAAFAALAALTWGAWGDVTRDTGFDLVAGSRVAHGSLPYVDYPYPYGPLGPLLLGAAGFLGGGRLVVPEAVGLAVAAAVVAAVFVLARQLAGTAAAAVAATAVAGVAFAPTNYSFVLPHATAGPLGILCVLVALLALARLAMDGGNGAALAAGVAAGAAALTRLEAEAAVLVALATWLVLRARAGEGRRRETLLLLVPALGLPLAVYGAAAARVGLAPLVRDDLYPVAFLRAGGATNLRGGAPLTAASAVHLAGATLAYGLGVLALALAGRLRRDRMRRAVPALCALAVLAALALTAARPETLRYGLKLAYAWVPGGAVVAFALLATRAWRSRSPSLGVLAAAAAALLVLAARSYDAFYVYATRPQIAAYVAPLAVLLLVATHRATGGWTALPWLAFLAAAGVALTVHDARTGRVALRGPAGTLRVPAADARALAPALRAVEAAPRGGDVLLAPQLTTLYALAGRRDPLPEISLLPGSLGGRSGERRALATLRHEPVVLVVTDRRPLVEYGQTAWGKSYDRLLALWVRRHFIHAATLRAPQPSPHVLDVWRRGTQ